MTPTTFAPDAERASDTRVITLVSAAHFVSHYYILLLPPLFPFVRAEFGVSYTELGMAIAAFNVVSGAMQTPAGFLVDRWNARAVLIGGLVLGACALGLAGLVSWFWAFVAMFAFAGLANAVYHPADYALLTRRVALRHMGKAYAVHTFAGILGSAVAPASLLLLAAAFGWRGAFLAAAALGFVVAAVLVVMGDVLAGRDPPTVRARTHEPGAAPQTGWRLLLSASILINFVFFIVLSMGSGGVQNYSVVALEALRGTPLAIGNLALSVYLFLNAMGVLLGGYVAARTPRHDGVAMFALAASASAVLLIALLDVGTAILLVLMGAAGLSAGVMAPSRDMLVRVVTPPGAVGTVFGFVTTGFNIAGVVAPLVFGWLMDRGDPQAVLLVAACASLAAIPLVMINAARTER